MNSLVMRSDHLRLHVGVFITFISPRTRADSRQLPLLFPPLKTNVKYGGFSSKSAAHPSAASASETARQMYVWLTPEARCEATAWWRQKDFNHHLSPGGGGGQINNTAVWVGFTVRHKCAEAASPERGHAALLVNACISCLCPSCR